MRRYTIRYERTAEKQLATIRDLRLALDLKAAIEALAETPRPIGVVKLKGEKDSWRLRVGDWRVVYRIDDGRLVVMVVKLGTRGGVYR